MSTFTVERAYLAPVFQHLTVEAATVEEAMRLALAHDDWEGSKTDYETSGETRIEKVWNGTEAYAPGTLVYQADAQSPVPP